jgi:hypothetical protein
VLHQSPAHAALGTGIIIAWLPRFAPQLYGPLVPGKIDAVTYSEEEDLHGPHWEGLAWSNWHQLDTPEARAIPPEPGIYRLRCRGEPNLIYVGISDRLRSRLGGLRRARGREDKRGHYAAACVAAHEGQGKIVEVSWATVGNMDRRELMGREVDLIAAHRKRFGNPVCQFHGQLEWSDISSEVDG